MRVRGRTIARSKILTAGETNILPLTPSINLFYGWFHPRNPHHVWYPCMPALPWARGRAPRQAAQALASDPSSRAWLERVEDPEHPGRPGVLSYAQSGGEGEVAHGLIALHVDSDVGRIVFKFASWSLRMSLLYRSICLTFMQRQHWSYIGCPVFIFVGSKFDGPTHAHHSWQPQARLNSCMRASHPSSSLYRPPILIRCQVSHFYYFKLQKFSHENSIWRWISHFRSEDVLSL